MIMNDKASLVRLRPFFSATFPLPPGVNHAQSNVTLPSKKTGEPVSRRCDSAAQKAFKQEAYLKANLGYHDWELIDAVRSSRPRTPLFVSIIFYYSTMWKCDIDGGIKVVQDVAFKHLGLNDNLVKRLVVEKEVDHEEPRAEIEISFYVK